MPRTVPQQERLLACLLVVLLLVATGICDSVQSQILSMYTEDDFIVAASDEVFEEGVLVTWSGPEVESVLFKVFRDDVLLSYAASNDTSYLDRTAVPLTEYDYDVHMYDVQTDNELDMGSDIGSRALFPPGSVTASDGLFEDYIQVIWEDHSEIEDGYRVYRKEEGDDDALFEEIASLGSNRSFYADTSAVVSVNYEYRVRAHVQGMESSSDPGEGPQVDDRDTGYRSYVLAPSLVNASDGLYADSVVVTWDDQTNNESGYRIYRDGVLVKTAIPNTTRFVDTSGLYTLHEYCIAAIRDMDDEVVESGRVCDLGIGGHETLAGPDSVKASDGTFDDRVLITWEHHADLADSFLVARNDTIIARLDAATTSYDDFEVAPSGPHSSSYCVKAKSTLGGTSSYVCDPDGGRRAYIVAPANVSASDGDFERYVEVSWESNSTTTVLFKIIRNGRAIATLSENERSYRDYSTSPGDEYDYWVQGVTAQGRSSDAVWDAGRRELRPPVSLEATDDAFEDLIRITWIDASEAETGFRIYRRHPDSAAVVIDTTAVNRTAYDDKTTLPSVEYEYSVRAFDALGESDAGTDAGRRTLLAPTSVEATDGIFEKRIDITWEDNSYVESKYYIRRNGVLIDSTGPDTTSYTDVVEDFGVEHVYAVTARDEYGESDPDSDSGFTDILPPGSVNASDVYEDRVVITWLDESGIETGYEIYRDGDYLTTTGANATTYTDTPSEQDVAYAYCVKSISGAASSEDVCDTGMSPSPIVSEPHKKIIAGDSEANDKFGSSVATHGDFAIIGSPGDEFPGSAYIFKRDGSAWTRMARLTATDPNEVEGFGTSVAISQDFAIIGAPLSDIVLQEDGSAYVFKRDGSSWTQMGGRLFPTETVQYDANFGTSVDIYGDVAVVGAPGQVAGSGVGCAYVFERNGSTWTDIQKLAPIDIAWASGFGRSVAIHGDHIIVGARADDANGTESGSAFIFTFRDSIWIETAKLTAADGDAYDWFGSSVAVEDDYVIVGARTDDVGSLADCGSAYIFKGGESSWVQTKKLTASDGSGWDWFGESVAIHQDHVVVGAWGDDIGGNDGGSAYIFRRSEDDDWTQTDKLTASDATAYDYLGASVAIYGDQAIAGAPGDDIGGTDGGSAYAFTVMTPPPSAVVASDGTFDDRIRIEWQSDSRAPDGFAVYRDGHIVATVSGAATSYNDFSAKPGYTYEYSVTATRDGLPESNPAHDFGRRPPDGNIGGRVTTQTGSAVNDVSVCLSPPPSRALLLDGFLGHARTDGFETSPLTKLTLEFWMRTDDVAATKNGTPFSYANNHSADELTLLDYTNLTLYVGGQHVDDGVDISANDGEWHHIAVTWDSENGDVEIFKDGESVSSYSGLSSGHEIDPGGVVILGQDQDAVGGDFEDSEAFLGQLDEMRLWNKVRNGGEIRASMYQTLRGDEDGLMAYWPMDQGRGVIIDDLGPGDNYGTLEGGIFWSDDAAPLGTYLCATTDLEGNYTLANVRYGNSTTFEVTPSRESRQFEPAFKSIALNTQHPIQNEVHFTDVSSYTVWGHVYFPPLPGEEDPTCFVKNVEIYVDEVIAGNTDAGGRFEVSVTPGDHIIEAKLGDHDFSPPSYELSVASDTHLGDFVDTTTRTLSGRVTGGCGVSFGTLDLNIRSEDGCFTLDEPGIGPDYNLELPPQKYFALVTDVQVTSPDLDPIAIETFFDNLGPQEVDLRGDDAVLDFVYRAPLRIEIEGLPAATCDSILVNPEEDNKVHVPILRQGEAVSLTIKVYEYYGPDALCPVDTGVVTIYDEIMDVADEPTEVGIKDGVATYTTVANTPNVFPGGRDIHGIDRSYQKSLAVFAEVEGQDPIQKTEWVIVTGDRPRTGTFVTATTDEIPLLILRDPPGDASSGFVATGRTMSTIISDVSYESRTAGGYVEAKCGIAFSKGGVFITTETKTWIEVRGGLKYTAEVTETDDLKLSVTTTEKFSTSGSDVFVGPDADIFLGVAMNIVFAKTDVLSIDQTGDPCEVVKSQTVRFGLDHQKPFETLYLYTQRHIRETIIPQFEDLAGLEPDSTAAFAEYTRNWRAILARGDLLREMALEIPQENRSFSAGADYEFTQITDTTRTFAWESRVGTDGEEALEFGFEEAGSGFLWGLTARLKLATTRIESETEETAFTVGYILSDDDPGDYFTTDIGFDPQYGTPAFGLRAGRSSCPWEPGTQPRDSAVVAIEPRELHEVPPDDPAVFRLKLGNDSPSEETRTYVLLPVNTSNPGGALMRVNGETFHDGITFRLDPAQTQDVTLTVERGPIDFYYPGLSLLFRSECDGSIANTVSFSVDFDAPCSDVTLHEPASNWSLNQAQAEESGHKIPVSVKDFQLEISEEESLIGVAAQYRAHGDPEWFPIGDAVNREDIPVDSETGRPHGVEFLWDVGELDDGAYEVRGMTICQEGNGYSEIATGRIDTEKPRVFGDPEPADGVLSLGDAISITFNEDILPESGTLELWKITADNDSSRIVDAVYSDRTIVMKPRSWSHLEGYTLRAKVSGVEDLVGNPMEEFPPWEFIVRRSAFAWSEEYLYREVAYRNPARISAELVNGKHEDVNFRIRVEELPAWLTSSVTQDLLRRGESMIIHFDVAGDPYLLPLGSHEEVVVRAEVQGPAPDLLPETAWLHITIDVTCQEPTWSVNPADFEQTMNIVAELSIGEQASNDTRDLVAAFAGSEIRGLAQPMFVEEFVAGEDSTHAYRVFMTIFSNRSRGEPVRFQVWDDSECRLYNGTESIFVFTADSTIGTPDYPELLEAIDLPPDSLQVIGLDQGWTWFSVNLIQPDMSVSTLLSGLNPAPGDIIKSQTEFCLFDPSMTWVGSLQKLDVVSMYAIRLSEAGSLVHIGEPVDLSSVTIPVQQYWNWIGYLPREPLDVGEALDNLQNKDNDVIKSQQGFAQYDQSLHAWLGDLQMMEPGIGYKLYHAIPNPPEELEYPDPGGSELLVSQDAPGSILRKAGEKAPLQMVSDPRIQEETGPDWSVNAGAFQYNMTVTCEVRLAGAGTIGDQLVVAGFVADEVRGVTRVQQVPQLDKWLAFLMIYSDNRNNEAVSFRVYDESRDIVLAVDETIDFEADQSVGTPTNPLVLSAAAGAGNGMPQVFSLGQSSPNPLTMSATGLIRYGLPIRTHVAMRVFDVQGREILSLVDEEQPPGWHHVELDPSRLSSGVYFCRIRAKEFNETRKLVIIR